MGCKIDKMKIVIAGTGSIARKHIEALQNIGNITIGLLGIDREELEEVAKKYGLNDFSTSSDTYLTDPSVDGVILATPTPLHVAQTIEWLEAGKHVLVEIPMAESLEGARSIVAAQKRTGKNVMVAHTRRFNPPHQWIRKQIEEGKLHLHHLAVETLFHRRENKSALGKERDWTDHLLWHHAAHSVDLFRFQTQEAEIKRWALQGPKSAIIGVPLDMNIGIKSISEKLLTVTLSFNNQGPLGSWFRYICEEGTFKVRYDEIVDGNNEPVEIDPELLSRNGFEWQDLEFIHSIKEGRSPKASANEILPSMEVLHKLEYIASN